MEPEDDVPPGLAEMAAADDAPTNLLEQLAAKRKELSDTKETFIPVPGYDRHPPLLLVRYKMLAGPELNIIGEKIRREVKDRLQRSMLAAVDTFIAAAIGLFVDQGDNKPPEPLTYQGVTITGFTPELAEALQFTGELSDPPTARSIVFKLFADNDSAIAKHNYMLNRWFTDPTLDVGEEMDEGNL